MYEATCCIVHGNIYISILCIALSYIIFIMISPFVFGKSLSWIDLGGYATLFVLFCILVGRLFLLNVGLFKDVYDEAQCYAGILIYEKSNLFTAFPFIQRIENPDILSNMTEKNIPINIYCNENVTEAQCKQVEKFILYKISSMGGGPYATLNLSIFIPSYSDSSKYQALFAKTITINAQKSIWNIDKWILKAFPAHQWLGILALLILIYLQVFNIIIFYIKKTDQHISRIFSWIFSLGASVVLGYFYILNNFCNAILCHYMLQLLLIPYMIFYSGYWSFRFYIQKKQMEQQKILISQFFLFVSLLLGLFLLFTECELYCSH